MANVSYAKTQEYRIGDVVFGHLEWRATFADLTESATGENLSIPGFPAQAYPLDSTFNVGVDFAGGAITDVKIRVGDAGDVDELTGNMTVFTGVENGTWTRSIGVLAEYGTSGPAPDSESAYDPIARFVTFDGNVNDLTAGEVSGRIYYKRYINK